ncbi:MAG: 2-dehydropantoate 2-reductase [Candidatus Hydrogenedens sp.]|nr:2-dehydropantoate 2-reductase [Candidatus Hydrogenedens sp.]
MRIGIIGAGAIGSCVGGFMTQAGHEVHLLGRPAHLHAIQSQGLHIAGIWGDHRVTALHCHSDAGTMPHGELDLVLITVKSYATREAAAIAAQLAGPGTLVCSYQNGLGNADVLAEDIDPARVVAARAIYGVRVTEPGAIEVTVIAQPTALGSHRPDIAGPDTIARVEAIAAAMNDAGLPTVAVDDIAPVLWAKVTYNCALNPMSALLDVPYGRLPEIPETRGVMDQVIDEIYAVAAAMQIRLQPTSADEYRALFYERLVPPTAAHYASMREDLLHGRRTEIDALNGAIDDYGKQHGVDCPVNRMLANLVRAREAVLGAN